MDADTVCTVPPGPADERTLADAFRRFAVLSSKSVAALYAMARTRTLVVDEPVLHAGDPAADVAVVMKGVLREYFPLRNGGERTKAFAIEGELSGSLADLLRAGPSSASIVAEEPTRLLLLPYTEMRAKLEEHGDWEPFAIAILESLFLRKVDREFALLALDADERYSRFQRDHPGLESRLRARHVASYLGITAVHLSRLRRRRRAADTL